MTLKHLIIATTAALGLSQLASAQPIGAMPLAWRWAQASSVAPGGTLVASGDTIFVAAGPRIYALDRSSGNQKWRFPAGEPLEANFRNGCIRVGDTIVAAADNKTVYGVSAETGASKWSYVALEPLTGLPVVAGTGVVFRQGDGSMISLNPENGQPNWENPLRMLNGTIAGSLVSSGSTIIVATSANEVVGLDPATKKALWTKTFSGLNSDVRPVLYNDTVYVVSGEYLSALNATSGSRRWEINVKAPLARNPAVSLDGIAVMTREGQIYTFDLGGRALLKKPLDLGSLPIDDPVLFGSTLAVSTSNGSLNLIDIKTCQTLWNYILRPFTAINDDKGKPITFVTPSTPPILTGKTLLIGARDGSVLAFDSEEGVDLTAPEIKMLFPSPGDQVSGRPPLFLAFRVSDDASGVKMDTVAVKIDGVEYTSNFSRDGLLTVQFSQTGKNRMLMDGRRTITVTSADWLGNVSTKEFAITIDNTLKPVVVPGSQDSGGTGGKGGGGGPGGRDAGS